MGQGACSDGLRTPRFARPTGSAPPMASEPSSPRLNVARLARTGSSWRGALAAAAFERLGRSHDASDVQVSLDFTVDDQGRPRVTGRCRLTTEICCGRCAEEVAVDVDSDIDFRVVATEAEAGALTPDIDAVVCNGPTMRIAELIEDDLLLNMPEIGCADRDSCPNASQFREPGSEVEGEGEGMSRESPFAAIKSLKPGRSPE